MKIFKFLLPMLFCVVVSSCALSESGSTKGAWRIALFPTAETYKDKYVVARTVNPSVIAGFYLRREEYTDLRIFGRNFHNVRGSKPFYIMVTNLNSIVFVTEDRKEQGHLHIMNLKTKVDTKILISGIFGGNIGYEQYGRKQGDECTDYIDNVGTKGLRINAVSVRWRESSVIDIASKSVSERESIIFDKDKKIIKRYINGELVQ
jgi:hypothetical protein